MQKPLFLEDYPSFGPFDREALRQLTAEIKSDGVRFAEVGSWLGTGSTQVLIQALHNGRGALYCIDTWKGSEGVARHREIVERYEVFATFRHNVRLAGGGDIVRPMQMTSQDAASIIADRSMDLVFLDGDHSYEATRTDIAAWLPKVRPGGILCGHDCETRLNPGNQARLQAARDQDAVSGDTRFECFHPGVVVAVSEAFGERAQLFAEQSIVLADGRVGTGSIWYVRV